MNTLSSFFQKKKKSYITNVGLDCKNNIVRNRLWVSVTPFEVSDPFEIKQNQLDLFITKWLKLPPLQTVIDTTIG
jgi:hypothetical protein